MQRLLFFFLFLVPSYIIAQVVDIPDPNFLDALLQTEVIDINGNIVIKDTIDTNGDGMIQFSEAEVVESLVFDDVLIHDLTGIEAFFNLKVLICQGAYIQGTVDLSNLEVLEHLDLRYNWISEIILGSDNLLYLDLEKNYIPSIDIPNESVLEHLNLSYTGDHFAGFDASSLQISTMVSIKYLDLGSIELDYIDLSNCILLEELYVHGNFLHEIDLSNLIELRVLHIGSNDLFSLETENNPKLEELNCYNNKFEDLDFSANSNLRLVRAHDNDLYNINISACDSLRFLGVSGNNLTTLNLENAFELEQLMFNDNSIQSLNLKSNTNLFLLKCLNNPLFKLDLSGLSVYNLEFGNPELLFVHLGETRISDLDVEDLSTNLKYVCGRDYNIIKLNYYYNLDDIIVNGLCNFTLGDNFNILEIRTKFAYDLNACDNSDVFLGNATFEVKSDELNLSSPPNHDGIQRFYLLSGNYTITPVLSNPELFNINPNFLDIDIGIGQDTFVREFCLIPNGLEHFDLTTKLIPLNDARPGYDVTHKVVIANKGNIANSGMVKIFFADSLMNFIPNNEGWIIEEDSLSLSFIDLLPLERREFLISFHLNSPMDDPPLTVNNGLAYRTLIEPTDSDYVLDNNEYKVRQNVVDSYDPNDKQCLQGNYWILDPIGNKIAYRIRFENTGTANAINVTIKDTISEKFDIASIRLIDASHDVYMQTEGNVAEFVFENIYLPFSDDNNDGYVVFEIAIEDFVEVGDTLNNKAAIFFDFNFPIITNITRTVVLSDADKDGYNNLDDCDDGNSLINPGMIEILYNGLDDDCDPSTLDDDLDQDGYGINTDCNDDNSSIHPEAAEVCGDGIDQNCDGIDIASTYYLDSDRDGFGDFLTVIIDCVIPLGYVSNGDDCEDQNPIINPGMIEVLYNGIDDDCNSTTLDDDLDQDGYGVSEDCDDNNPSINPGAEEIPYNGLDDDCDPLTLDDDQDGDGYVLATDCDDTNPLINPASEELCDGLDNNCNEAIDEGLDVITYYIDLDQDGYGDNATATEECSQPAGMITIGGDCDDNNALINPSVTEIIYNGVNDDCDPSTLDDDLDGDGYVFAEDCDDDNSFINPEAEEICDGLDNNCNEAIDEDLALIIYYIDQDQDGYGDDATAREECSHPDGLITIGGDCNDTDPLINPGAEDIVNNGIDEDCDGMDTVSSLSELTGQGISIYPNPVDDLLYIQQEQTTSLSTTVYNLEGKRLIRKDFSQSINTLDLSALTSGVYFVRINRDDRVFNVRVLVR